MIPLHSECFLVKVFPSLNGVRDVIGSGLLGGNKIGLLSCGCCEGCLVVRSGHGHQAEVAQGVGPGPLVEL